LVNANKNKAGYSPTFTRMLPIWVMLVRSLSLLKYSHNKTAANNTILRY